MNQTSSIRRLVSIVCQWHWNKMINEKKTNIRHPPAAAVRAYGWPVSKHLLLAKHYWESWLLSLAMTGSPANILITGVELIGRVLFCNCLPDVKTYSSNTNADNIIKRLEYLTKYARAKMSIFTIVDCTKYPSVETNMSYQQRNCKLVFKCSTLYILHFRDNRQVIIIIIMVIIIYWVCVATYKRPVAQDMHRSKWCQTANIWLDRAMQ